ncbi:MAG TPA: nuclear transport factor 2 family protein [Thermohalobaculum sp.]|nr:nuclear transport factor 2 family protein [Thermohalobaculum sp.]
MTDYEAIEATVTDYYEGYKTKDRARLERAFAVEVANLMGYRKGEGGKRVLSSTPIPEVIDRWTSPDTTPLKLGEGRILSVNIFSEVAAGVVFDFGGVFLDEFQMAKIDGQWRIVNKFFVDH